MIHYAAPPAFRLDMEAICTKPGNQPAIFHCVRRKQHLLAGWRFRDVGICTKILESKGHNVLIVSQPGCLQVQQVSMSVIGAVWK